MKRLLVAALVCLLLGACSKEEGNRRATFPVTGEVVVDGKPVEKLSVMCLNVEGIDKENPTMSQALTDENGKFEIATYESGDGVPVGDYVLTFTWGEFNPISMTFTGDKLNGRYADAKKSKIRFTVKEGEPTDLGKIELTTK